MSFYQKGGGMKEKMEQENILGKEKIGKLILKFSIPCIVSMLVNSLYNIVDQIFIGQGVGPLGNGATNVVFPLVMIGLAFSLMFGDICRYYKQMVRLRPRLRNIPAAMTKYGAIHLSYALLLPDMAVQMQSFLQISNRPCPLSGYLYDPRK